MAVLEQQLLGATFSPPGSGSASEGLKPGHTSLHSSVSKDNFGTNAVYQFEINSREELGLSQLSKVQRERERHPNGKSHKWPSQRSLTAQHRLQA
jgi:hypothetical protein